MYSFSLSTDKQLIRDTILLPNNIPFNFDDKYKDPFDYEPLIQDNIMNIRVDKGGEFMGFFFLIKRSYTLAEAHLAFTPKAFGEVAEMGKECLKWIWNNTGLEHLICPVIETNHLALKCVKAIGLKPYCRQENKWLKDGIWYHYIWLKIEKDHNIIEEEV